MSVIAPSDFVAQLTPMQVDNLIYNVDISNLPRLDIDALKAIINGAVWLSHRNGEYMAEVSAKGRMLYERDERIRALEAFLQAGPVAKARAGRR